MFSLFLILSNLEFLWVLGVIVYVGALMEVGILILGLFIKRFEMFLRHYFLGRAFKSWKVKVPKRLAFFMWMTAHFWILTSDNLMLRGLSLANRCCLCHVWLQLAMRKLWIISFFFVLQLMLCGCICFKFLGFIGTCQV